MIFFSNESGAATDVPIRKPGELERLSREYAVTRDPELRERLIFSHQRLVRSIASRFQSSGESLEDLIQIGNIGLINALDRFDPSQGTRFSTYATPTIVGEIKRHFRDRTGGMKVPRWLQELHQSARHISQVMTGELGRPPSVPEIAARLGVTEEETVEALECAQAQNPISLNASVVTETGESGSLMDMLGDVDRAMGDVLIYGDLRGALETLNSRERQVIALRFFQEMSQARIAERLNISQMHVSRLQQRALVQLRNLLATERNGAEPAPREPAKIPAKRSSSPKVRASINR